MANEKPTTEQIVEVDVFVNDCGSIIQITPMSANAMEWIDENVESEGWQWLGGALCVGHHFADALIEGMQSEGLIIAPY